MLVKTSRLLILLTLGVIFPSMVFANPNNERTYQIEMIVFSHLTKQGLNSEQWPWTPTTYRSPRNVMSIEMLEKSAYRLAFEEKLLSNNKNYNVLLHLAWTQKIASPNKAQPIHVYGGNIYSSSGKQIGTARYGKQNYQPNQIWQVNGTITPSLIRYIDLKFNLLFAQPISSLPGADRNDNVQGSFAYFRLQETRRMRSKELNYIGHPLYGIIVKVIPVA